MCLEHATSAERACEELIDIASKKWSEREGDHRDDITVSVAFLQVLIAKSCISEWIFMICCLACQSLFRFRFDQDLFAMSAHGILSRDSAQPTRMPCSDTWSVIPSAHSCVHVEK